MMYWYLGRLSGTDKVGKPTGKIVKADIQSVEITLSSGSIKDYSCFQWTFPAAIASAD